MTFSIVVDLVVVLVLVIEHLVGRVGKGEDFFEAEVDFEAVEATSQVSAAVVVGLSNFGLINTNRTNLESFYQLSK